MPTQLLNETIATTVARSKPSGALARFLAGDAKTALFTWLSLDGAGAFRSRDEVLGRLALGVATINRMCEFFFSWVALSPLLALCCRFYHLSISSDRGTSCSLPWKLACASIFSRTSASEAPIDEHSAYSSDSTVLCTSGG